MFLAYKGAPVWKMQAGMGDVVFGPFYEILERHGGEVQAVPPRARAHRQPDLRSHREIKIGRQATVKPEQLLKGGYAPLVDVNGLPCWPATPLYDQLVEGVDQLKAEKIDLESYCTPWQDVEITLKLEWTSIK